MAVKLMFERTKGYDIDDSEILNLAEQSEAIDQECIDNGIILSLHYEVNDNENLRSHKGIYIFESKTHFENYLEIFKNSNFIEARKTIWNWKLQNNYQYKFHLDYNYII